MSREPRIVLKTVNCPKCQGRGHRRLCVGHEVNEYGTVKYIYEEGAECDDCDGRGHLDHWETAEGEAPFQVTDPAQPGTPPPTTGGDHGPGG